MILLRIVLAIYALVYLVGGYLLIRSDQNGIVIGAYFIVNGLIILIAAVFERGRYRPHTKNSDGWVVTNERFIDDTTGKTMEVRYNRQTGERDYAETK